MVYCSSVPWQCLGRCSGIWTFDKILLRRNKLTVCYMKWKIIRVTLYGMSKMQNLQKVLILWKWFLFPQNCLFAWAGSDFPGFPFSVRYVFCRMTAWTSVWLWGRRRVTCWGTWWWRLPCLVAESGARLSIWGKMKKMEKTGNNILHVFNPTPIPNLAFLCLVSTLQLTLHTLFTNSTPQIRMGKVLGALDNGVLHC